MLGHYTHNGKMKDIFTASSFLPESIGGCMSVPHLARISTVHVNSSMIMYQKKTAFVEASRHT
jgi:hypothetical protein